MGGTLLLTPGFLSDILGFFVLLPVTRPLARRLLLHWGARRMGSAVTGLGGSLFGGSAAARRRGPGRGTRPAGGSVIDGEVVDEHIERPRREP